MPYPVTFEVEYATRRNRLTTFFRLIVAVPLFIWDYVWGLVACVAIVLAWFVIVITGRFPEGLYRFVAGFVAETAIIVSYTALLVDRYPPFLPDPDSDYPVRMRFSGPLPRYSRLKTFFRGLLAIPVFILRYVLGLLLEIASIAAWVTIIILGRLPVGLFDMLVLVNSYTARSDAYLYLLTETYPPFQDDETRAAGTVQA